MATEASVTQGTPPAPNRFGGRVQAQSELALPLNHGSWFLVEGTGTIRKLTASNVTTSIVLAFTGAATLVHSTNLILPGAANATMAAGDAAELLPIGDGAWRCVAVDRTSGKPLIGPAAAEITDSGTIGRALLQSATAAAAEAALAQTQNAQSTDYTLLTTDRGKHIPLTGDAKTLTFLAAATAGDDFWFTFTNEGTGVWTFDPNSTELIDALSTIKIFPGESGTVRCNGTAWRTIGLDSYVLLETRILSAVASSDFNRFDSGRFGSYRFEISELVHSTTGLSQFVRVSVGGSYITSANYNYSLLYNVASTDGGSSNMADTVYLMKSGMDTARAAAGWLELHTLTSSWSNFSHQLGGADNTPNGYIITGVGGMHSGASPIDGVRFFPSAGTMSCEIRMYGKKK
jgi:hypothetical protein